MKISRRDITESLEIQLALWRRQTEFLQEHAVFGLIGKRAWDLDIVGLLDAESVVGHADIQLL